MSEPVIGTPIVFGFGERHRARNLTERCAMCHAAPGCYCDFGPAFSGLDAVHVLVEPQPQTPASLAALGWAQSAHAIKQRYLSCPCCDALKACALSPDDRCSDCGWHPGLPIDRSRPSSNTRVGGQGEE